SLKIRCTGASTQCSLHDTHHTDTHGDNEQRFHAQPPRGTCTYDARPDPQADPCANCASAHHTPRTESSACVLSCGTCTSRNNASTSPTWLQTSRRSAHTRQRAKPDLRNVQMYRGPRRTPQ